MARIRTGIVNVTGYTGMELARLLAMHPGVDLVSVTGRTAAGQQLPGYLPHLDGSNLTITHDLDKVDLAFLALPHRESSAHASGLLKKGTRVIDLSADFRLKDASMYEKWYGFNHPDPQLLEQAVYGLPEFNRSIISTADLVANPGCYPTAALLALAPSLEAGIIENGLIIDAKSGLSGSGRGLTLKNHFCEASEDVAAYALEGHRHLPEIIQQLQLFTGTHGLQVTFTPHLVPATRGILVTCYASLRNKTSPSEVLDIYRAAYAGEPFVRITGSAPHTKQTRGSNYCCIHPVVDQRTDRLVVIAAMDNLVKGAAGQAVQNMNIMLGLPETTGLDALPLYP